MSLYADNWICDVQYNICMVAAAVAGGAVASVAGSALSAGAAGSAANAQEAAANNATRAQLEMFQQTQGNEQPFISAGNNANTALSFLLGTNKGDASGETPNTPFLLGGNGSVNQYALNGEMYAVPVQLGSNFTPSSNFNGLGVADLGPAPANYFGPSTPGGNPLTSYFGPITPNLATIAQTPGYQFNLNQGLKSVQNGAAARGLGISGASLKGAANFATGLADSTYQNQFSNLLTNQTNVFNRLFGQATLGANAAANLGTNATTTGQGIASNDIGAGNAAAAGTIGSASALSSGLSNSASTLTQTAILNQLLKQNGGSGLFAGPDSSSRG